jgi:arylsulfatase A-like enzyme
MAKRNIFDSAWIYFVGAALLIVAAVASQIEVKIPHERPEGSVEDLLTLAERDDLNVMFIVIDTLRADAMNAYGSPRITSPVMADLASTGIRFESVESQSSWTKASMASMWQGMYPERTKIQRYFQTLTDDAQMATETLKDAGFLTGGIWRNGWVAANFGFNQGFDLYVRPNPTRRVGMQLGNPSAAKLNGTDYDTTEAAFGFLETYKNERFFLYLHYMDVHQSLYADTSPLYGTNSRDFYDSSIHWVDRNVGMLVDALKDRNLADKTMIVILSDHGEGFFEHGQEGHARTLFTEVQKVPLIIIPPFKIPGGVVVEPQVANVDIWPTLFDILDLPPLSRADGKSLLPLILDAGGTQATRDSVKDQVAELSNRSIFSQLDLSWGKIGDDSDPLLSMLKDDHRTVLRMNREGHEWLYDHAEDPRERVNLAKDQPELVADYRGEMQAFLDFVPEDSVEIDEVELDQMRLHQLRALGYVIEPRTKKAPEAK